MARLAGVRDSPYCRARLMAMIETAIAPMSPALPIAASHAAEAPSLLCGRYTAPISVTPSQIQIDFAASVSSCRRRTRVLPSAKRKPAESPNHSARDYGHGTPISGRQSIVIAPANASAITARPARSSRSWRRIKASGTVQSGAR